METGARRTRRARAAGRIAVLAALVAPGLLAAGVGDGGGDELAASRRLRERAATLRPLREAAPSALTQDVGQIAVMEHDGSDYSRSEPDGTPNYAPRAALAQRFYQTHGDFYDFLVVFTNFEFETGNAVAFHNLVRNDVQGIGKPIADNGPLFGSPGRLRGYVDMAAIDRYGRAPLSVRPGVPLSTRPGDYGFRDTLNVLGHEVAHQWLAQVRYRNAGGQNSSDLLGRDGAHWSYLLDSDGSLMYGADWVARGPGEFRAERVLEGYSPLDLYLMGFRDPARVQPFSLLRNPAVDPTGLPREGDSVQADVESVALAQVIAAEGARQPGFLAAPKTFRVGFILLTAPGTTPSSEDLLALENVRAAFAGHFFALTHGVAVADTTLAEAPPVPPLPAPDLDLALQWLLAQQLADGRWEDTSGSAVRDTTAVLDALRDAGLAPEAYERGRLFLLSIGAANTDFVARRAQALAPALSEGEKSALAQALLARQNRDGGFGAGPGYQSDPLDTALALRALAALGWANDVKITRALVLLRAVRLVSGGWPAVPGGAESPVATAQGLLALQDWAANSVAQPLLGPVMSALAARRNADGGFGDGASTAYAGALALHALLRGGAPSSAVDPTIAWLQAVQRQDGSWGGSRFETALVLGALKGGVTPNLVVPPDTLVLTPPQAHEGQLVQVAALVRNTGRRPAAASVARLYDGDPGDPAHAVADAAVPALEPGEEAAVAFDYDTNERAGRHTLYVVADAERQVAEAREDDNSASRALLVTGRLPDFVMFTGDLDVTPYPPEDGEVVEIHVTVRNDGQRDAPVSRVRVYLGNPRFGGLLLGEATLPPIAQGASATVTLPWDTQGQQGSHELFAVADPDYAVDEVDETNNETSLPVTVTGPVPPGPDLEIARVSVDPPVLTRIPQAVSVRVLVRNLGRDAAPSSVRLSDDFGTFYGDLPVDLGPRSGTTLVFALTVGAPGDRTFIAVADPDGTLPEPNEGNNQGNALLDDTGNTVDLEVLPGEVTPSSTALVLGETLEVTAVVHNRGTAPVTQLPLLLVHALPTPAELARTFVSIPPGGAVSATLRWPASLTGDPLPLSVVADPFDLLHELSETNNRVDFGVTVSDSDLPNLAASGADISFVPEPPLEGQPAVVSVVVRNTGVVPAGPFTVDFWRGDPDQGGALIGSASLPGLDGGAQATPQVSWPSVDVRGAQGLFVRVDPDDAVAEFNEDDNRAFRPFTSIGLPDLVLTAGDVSLEPGYPRAGEPVTVRARVRNLGMQPAAAALLRASEGETNGGTTVGEVAIPALQPGGTATLSFVWTPAAPAGDRMLVLVADADDGVREQDEGNNRARRTVVVQDANLYLTEPYFSPDGDGVKDETSLAWRAAGTASVTVVVSNTRGQRVRVLVEAAPAEGSATWDGRDEHGRLMWDGRYTLTLQADNGAVLGRREAVLDTNRSPIHDAAGTGLIAVRNLTCALPQLYNGPAFTPAGDEALFILEYDDPVSGLNAGLLRVSSDSEWSYVGVPDAWYQGATLPFTNYDTRPRSPVARLVSPDGRELLVRKNWSELWAIDLATGDRRQVSDSLYSDGATWSPDGDKILMGNQVVGRDGSFIGWLPYGQWSWSPDGRFLAQGNVIYSPDGTFVKEIPVPDAPVRASGLFNGPSTTVGFYGSGTTEWRGDGKIFFGATGGGESPRGSSNGGDTFLVLDPDTDNVQFLTWMESLSNNGYVEGFDWSPDGWKVLYQGYDYSVGSEYTRVTREDGRGTRLLATNRVVPSANKTVGSFELYSSDAAAARAPGSQACNGYTETYALFNLQNLTAELQVSRLPANNGLMLRGTASDAWLDHYQLEYAQEAAPDVWHPIGGAGEGLLVNDDFTVWVPAAPGRYVVRLTVVDRAGNSRFRSRVVSWDRAPAIVNISQSERLISPNGDGRKDSVRFDYLVQEPTRLEVRIAGPARPSLPAPVVRRLSFEYPQLGPASFVWDGRDGAGQVVPDGRYTVYLNELPFRVDVDTTPPDQSWAETEPVLKVEPSAAAPGKSDVYVSVQRSWHVVDPRLKSWQAPDGEGAQQVYEPERDTAGNIVYDERGVPKILYVNGHAANLVEDVAIDGNVARQSFTADDLAGNVAVVAVPPRAEKLFLRFALEPDGTQRLVPPRAPSQAETIRPPKAVFLLQTTALEPAAPIFFRFQRVTGGAWSEAAAGLLFEADFAQLGVAFGVEYYGEFVQRLPGREIRTDTFRFRVCDAAGDTDVVPQPITPAIDTYRVKVTASVGEPIVNVRLVVSGAGPLASFRQEIDLGSGGPYVTDVIGPHVSCAVPEAELAFSAYVKGQSGRVYSGDLGCLRLSVRMPVCPNLLTLQQTFAGCAQTPDQVFLKVRSKTQAADAHLVIERGPEDAPVVLAQMRPPVNTTIVVDVSADPQGGFPVRARVTRDSLPAPVATAQAEVVVDRTPPDPIILEPVEGGTQCVAKDPQTGRETLRVTLEVEDGSRQSQLGAGRYRYGADPWRALGLVRTPPCASADPEGCRWLPDSVPVDHDWDVTGLPSGPYTVDQTFCDRSGNRANVVRQFEMTKRPPYLALDSISRRIFSPNGDGRAESTTVTIGLAQSLRLTVEVHRGSFDGPLVKRLVDNVTYFAGHHPFTWDGRDASGQAQPDGDYYVVAAGLDGCLNVGRVWAQVTVDTTPPLALIAAPTDGQQVSTSLDVLGRAADAHFAQYELAFGEGANPSDWTVILLGTGPVGSLPQPPGRLAPWSPPPVPGPDPVFYTLRLVAADVAENVSEVRVTVAVGPRVFLDHLTAEPTPFSPNADERRDTLSIEYQILLAGRVTLQVRTLGGAVLRTFESGVEHPAGTFVFVWDGRQDDAAPAPEGDLAVFVRVEDPLGGGSFQEQIALVALDRTPPAITILEPAEGAYVDRTAPVRGSVEDPLLVSYRVAATTPGGTLVELAQGSEPQHQAYLAALDVLPDGPYLLVVGGEDAAENIGSQAVNITVDSIAPEAALAFRPNEVLRRGSQPIDVKGRATDLNFESYELSFGPGPSPAGFTRIALGAAGGNGITLASWNVASVPDGVYTLRLVVRDKAAHTTEARETIALDGTPPEALIRLPLEAGYVTGETAVTGDARDANLLSWTLESAPGAANEAYQWVTLDAGDEPVDGGELTFWAPLAPDGVHTLRLTVKDAAGFETAALRTVTIDTTPPAPPTGLAAEILRNGGTTADVRLTWNTNTEPDLAGYRVFRDGAELTPNTSTQTLHLDRQRPDGTYRYEVIAIDFAGNESDPAPLPVRVDLTPPIVDIRRPQAGARLSGSVDVRGTAFSPDDFKEYRLLVGPGAAPSAFTLLRRATLPVPGGLLGTWTAVGDGPFTLALEAEDTSGNQARTTVTVVVDNDAPAAPVLTSVANTPDPTTLTSTWTPSTSTDVSGYLVERNGQIANAPGVVVGDLRPYLVPGPSYADLDLPDGEHCYRITAMDEAGNLSARSNEICRALDNHPPHVVLFEPPDGLRFDYPLHLLGFTLDTDVTRVQFQYKASASATWLDLGVADTQVPWETTFDPLALSVGDYDLRAVATDQGGNVDPNPEAITVTYGDATPPLPPRDVRAHVDGAQVQVEWTASTETDLAGYNVYRDGEQLTPAPQPEITYTDDGVAPGVYHYAVTAVDADGNESAPGSDDATVYRLLLEQPYPVTTALVADLSGAQAQPDTTVQVLRDGTAVAFTSVAAGPEFQVSGVPLVPAGNVFVARGEDAAGNRSIPSDEVVLISNTPPPPVTGVSATVTDHSVALAWTGVADPELAGYVVRRGDLRLTPSVAQSDYDSIVASSTYPYGGYAADNAFDGDPGTWWVPDTAPATWTVTFPAPVLVEKVALQFANIGSPLPAPARYRIEALWEGRFVALVRVLQNQAESAQHALPAPFQTAALRVVLEDGPYLGLAEVAVTKLDAVPAATTTFDDDPVPDGTHIYAVTAIDRYGAEGAPGTATAPVGDTLPPSPPIGLVAMVELSDVLLFWGQNPEPDIDHYVVLRDGVRIGTTVLTDYRDAGRPNGTYVYTVIAVDHEGQESQPSNPDTAVVNRTTPPAAPVILVPTDAANPVTLDVPRTPVRGRAEPNTLVTLDVNGVLAGVVPSRPAFVEQGRWTRPADAISSVLVAPDGERVAFARYVPEIGYYSMVVRSLYTGSERAVGVPGFYGFEPRGFSGDGRKLAYQASGQLYVADLESGALTQLNVSPGSGDLASLSADGQSVAFTTSYYSAGWKYELRVRDLVTGVQRQLALGSAYYAGLSWSPAGGRLAALVFSFTTFRYEVRLIDSATGAQTVIEPDAWPYTAPSWSADGARVAYTRYVNGVERVSYYLLGVGAAFDVTTGAPAAWDARFDREGNWLSFLRDFGSGPSGTRAVLVARQVHTGEELNAALIDLGWRAPLSLHEWVRGGYLHADLQDGLGIAILPSFDGAFGFASVALAPGQNTLVARALELVNGLLSPDSEPVLVTVPAGVFADLEVAGGDVTTYPAAPTVGQSTRLSVRVRNVGQADAVGVPVTLQLLDADGALILEQQAEVSYLGAGGSATVATLWTPAVAGSFELRGIADAPGLIVEAREDNNTGSRAVRVSPAGGGALAAELTSDRDLYPARTTALVQGQLFNGGAPFAGSAQLVVEGRDGTLVGVLDERAVSLGYGESLAIPVQWNTGATYAGDYRFALRAYAAGAQEPAAGALRDFSIEPDLRAQARLVPERASVPAGEPAGFSARVDNLSANAPLEGAVARLSILPAGGGAALYTADTPVPRLLPGAQWPAAVAWPVATPAGGYSARLDVLTAAPQSALLARAEAPFNVVAASLSLTGTLGLSPADVLFGQATDAQLSVTNRGGAALTGHALRVDVAAGASPASVLSVPFTLDLAPGETRSLTLALDSSTLAPGFYPAFLRSVDPPQTLARARLHVHGLIAPPSLDAPPEGSTVATAHPTLSVNNASTPENAPLTYEFQLFADAALGIPLPGAAGVAEGAGRTAFTVDTNLGEDHTYYWRARATDGFASSPWMDVASFTVDTANEPPTAPLPDSPAPGGKVATSDVTLVVSNAQDPELDPLTYEFVLAADPDLATIVASTAGIAEGPGLTDWHVPVALGEDQTYYWRSRAGDGAHLSPWSEIVSFTVDTFNGSPTAPTPISPVGGVTVSTQVPELRVGNATDPEMDPLTYTFQVDRVPSFDSPDLQVSPVVPETTAETAWTPAPLLDNTLHYWRAAASDGNTSGPWAGSSFFVNLANDPPGVPALLDPADGGIVTTYTPELRVRNAVDPDRDPLTYDFEVKDAGGAVVAAVSGVAETPLDTAWLVTPALLEDQVYTWAARASDGQAQSAWSAPWSFRVNVIPDPPGAPGLIAPPEGAVLDTPRPALVVSNASNPEGLPLGYTFELYRVVGGTPTLFDQVSGVPEGAGSTSWTPTLDLPDGDYSWRARAADANQAGAWMASAHFSVAVDRPPAAPTGLTAAPGDARVTLSWNAVPEPDVTSYRVYRSAAAGGPYALVATRPAPGYVDTGLTNGTTYYYVVTALDASFESAYSNEAAATPQGGGGPLVAEVRYWPSVVGGECILGCTCQDDDSPTGGECDDDQAGRVPLPVDGDPADPEARLGGGGAPQCPLWIKATIELPQGYDPLSIDVAGLRINGAIGPDPGYWRIVDTDGDGIPELEAAFDFLELAGVLRVGTNTLTLTGTAGGVPFSGDGTLEVRPPAVTLKMAPRTLNQKSNGQQVQARLSLGGCGRSGDFDTASLRLNETVPIERVVSWPGKHDVIVKFNRAAVIAVLPLGDRVEVRVSGRVRGLPFVAVDYIRVIP